MTQRLATTSEAATRAGVTFRQADYWCRYGVITPAVEADGSGSHRGWSAEDIAALAAMGQVAAVFSNERLSAVLAQVATAAREVPNGGPLTIGLPNRLTLTVNRASGQVPA